MEDKTKVPMEMSLEDGNSAEQLKDILNKKAQERLELENITGLNILKKSKFYYGNNGELREHIASYQGYAIMIKQEKIKEEVNLKENTMFPTLVTLTELKSMKKVNGNVIRKLNPSSIHQFEKMALVQGVVVQIDKGL